MRFLKRTASALVLGSLAFNAAAPAIAQTVPALTATQRTELDARPKLAQVMSAIRAQIAEATPDKPLVVLMGELHDLPTDVMLQQMIIEEFKKLPEAKGKAFAVGIEMPHNYLYQQLLKVTKGDLPVGIGPYLEHIDVDGQRTLRIMAATTLQYLSPLAHNNFYSWLITNNISTGFNDAARTADQQYIDASQETTASYVPASMRRTRIELESAKGALIRNTMIVGNAKYHIGKTKAAVYFQSAGLRHVFGSTTMGVSYDISLDAMFKKEGFKTLPISLSADSADYPLTEIPGALKLTGMSGARFDSRSGASGELGVIQGICTASGRLSNCFFSNVNDNPFWPDVRANALTWVDDAKRAGNALAAQQGFPPPYYGHK